LLAKKNQCFSFIVASGLSELVRNGIDKEIAKLLASASSKRA